MTVQVDWDTTAAGSTRLVQATLVTIATAATPGTIDVLTQGATDHDSKPYTGANPDSCATSAALPWARPASICEQIGQDLARIRTLKVFTMHGKPLWVSSISMRWINLRFR